MIAHPRPNLQIAEWYERQLESDTVFVIPEIADYELRRELLRADLRASLTKLDRLEAVSVYARLTTAVMRRAAEIWAQVRTRHKATAHNKALDGDVILAAQVEALSTEFDDLVVATDNVGHLSLMMPAKNWREINLP
jgi:predicted nucleic acid-binding protein